MTAKWPIRSGPSPQATNYTNNPIPQNLPPHYLQQQQQLPPHYNAQYQSSYTFKDPHALQQLHQPQVQHQRQPRPPTGQVGKDCVELFKIINSLSRQLGKPPYYRVDLVLLPSQCPAPKNCVEVVDQTAMTLLLPPMTARNYESFLRHTRQVILKSIQSEPPKWLIEATMPKVQHDLELDFQKREEHLKTRIVTELDQHHRSENMKQSERWEKAQQALIQNTVENLEEKHSRQIKQLTEMWTQEAEVQLLKPLRDKVSHLTLELEGKNDTQTQLRQKNRCELQKLQKLQQAHDKLTFAFKQEITSLKEKIKTLEELKKGEAGESTQTSDELDVPDSESTKCTQLARWHLKVESKRIDGKSDPWVKIQGVRVLEEGVLDEQENKLQWRSSHITNRVNNHLLEAVSQKMYQVIGPADVKRMEKEGLSQKFRELFADGFPYNWMQVIKEEVALKES